MKKIDANDPRFTAKALGESIDTPLDEINIESDDLSEFEELQGFVGTLKQELHDKDKEEALEDDQVYAIRNRALKSGKPIIRFPLWIGSLAACLAIGFVSILTIQNSKVGMIEEGAGDFVRINLATTPSSEPLATKSGESPVSYDALVKEENYLSTESLAGLETLEEPMMDYASFGTSVIVNNVRMAESEPVAMADEEVRGRMKRTQEQVLGRRAMRSEILKQQSAIAPATFNREAYDFIEENEFLSPLNQPLSTFSIDVDTASYANTRRFLNQGQRPPADAVRIEELINYFRYKYSEPRNDQPFSVKVDAASTPWNDEHRLVRIALKGKDVPVADRLDANLVFLIDVSGSMSGANKLPLVQKSLKLLVDQMEARDRIALVVYAGSSGLVLPSTTANNKETIHHAIDNLKSGGSTNGGAGIDLAYKVALEKFIEGGINRVILCTDGDFNVGTTHEGGLTRLIEEKRKTKVFFSALGFGMGNYRDDTMENLSNKGNGNYAYIDSDKEARKVMVDEMMGALQTIAKDVKIQVEFNPSKVSAYRLIGYENRKLAKEAFNDDTKDAGEIGAGHRVTALYEVVPAGHPIDAGSVDPLKYSKPESVSSGATDSDELLTVKLRYKEPDAEVSQLIEHAYVDQGKSISEADQELRFATAVAAWGMILRGSQYAGSMTLDDVIALGSDSVGVDSGGLRSEFIELVRKSKSFIEESNTDSDLR